ncbi:MAG: peptide chain release factor aRF-1 [Candidatus Bilamarchaeaceae archaeon]
MAISSEQDYVFRKKLKMLSKYRGSGTEMISVYISAGAPIHETGGKLREEMSQASNIKSKSTRNNVLGALERIINYLKMYRKTPENGICVFAGNISDNPSKVNIQLFSLEPPDKLSIGLYRCDSSFFLEPLVKMGDTKDSYGVVVLDGREATLATIKGTNVNILKRLNSTAHAKIRKGGQSARRYERLIEESIEKYYIRVGEAMDMFFLSGIKGVIVGGPGPTKEFFMKDKPYNYQIKVLGVVDTGYTDEYGIREVIAKSGAIIQEQEAVKEKIIVERFIKEVVKDGLATYGLNQVLDAVKKNQADKVLVSEALTQVAKVCECAKCAERKIIFIAKDKGDEQCPKCNEQMVCTEEELVDYVVELCREKGIEVEVISNNTAEGAQFLQGFAGLGAFLRYK